MAVQIAANDTDFRYFNRGVETYKNVNVVQGPVCHSNGIRGYGSLTAGVVFIGISPAKDEITRSRRPLTGPSGEMLDSCLEATGQARQDFYCTNIVCTWHNDPTEIQIQSCEQRLKYELSELKPKLIVLLGKIVVEQFTGRSFGKMRGTVQWNDEYNCYVMCTYHPSAILHSMGDFGSSKDDKGTTFIYDFLRDLVKIPDVVRWEPYAVQANVRYRVVYNRDDAQNILYNLPRSSDYPIGLDVETTYGKDDEQVEVFKDDLLCVGIGSDNFCWVFTPSALYDDKGKPCLDWPTGIHWVMHNSIFDAQVMYRKLGTWIDVKEDTMLQSYSLDERGGIHRLKTLAREYLAAGFYEEDRFYGKKKLDQIPPEMLYEYNARDVVYTVRLNHLFTKRQIEDNVRDFYLRLLVPAINMYKEAQYHGVNIDMEVHKIFTLIWGNKLLDEEAELQQMAQDYGWEGELNVGSNEQLGTFLFDILGLPCTKYTKGGKRSTDKDVIKALREQHEFIPKLEYVRRLRKMWGTYIVELPDKLKVDGRAHPIVKLHGTVTGRPSYSDLAVQTFVAPSVPHEFNKMRMLIKAPPFEGYEGTDGYVCPDDEEYVIVEIDYGKAELWVAQSYSNDPIMLADLLSGDYHTNVAMDIYEKAREQVTKDDRTWAKRTSFGIIYDIEEYTLSTLTNSTPLEARERINRWNARNKEYHSWSLDIQQHIRQHGEIVSKTGRKRRIVVLGNDHRTLKQAVNFPIQSTSNDIVLDSAINIHPKIKRIGGHLLFTMHDSIITKALKSRLREHCQIMHDEMIRQHFDGIRPIPVEIKIGTHWGNVEGVHDCAEKPDDKVNNSKVYPMREMAETCTWAGRTW